MPRSLNLVAFTLALSMANLNGVKADEPQTPSAEAKTTKAPAAGSGQAKGKRAVVVLRHGSAKELAPLLSRHFQPDAEIEPAPEPNNELLVSATPEAFEDVVRTIARLDHPVQRVIVDAFFFDVVSKRDGGAPEKAPDQVIEDRELAGRLADVSARLESLAKEKKIANFKHMTLSTLENREGTFQDGTEKPRISGFTPTGRGGFSRPTVQQRAVGTIVAATPRVVEGNKAVIDLTFRNDRLESAEEGVEIAQSEEGPIVSPEVATINIKTSIAVPLGQTIIAGRIKNDTGTKRTLPRLVLSARLAEEP